MIEQINISNDKFEPTKIRIPGSASKWREETWLYLRNRCATMAATTAVMKALLMRKASRCLRAVFGLKSNMKLWLILVFFHMNKLQP